MAMNIKLPAKIENLESVIRFVRGCAAEVGFSHERILNIELAVEEALANICHHAYQEAAGEMEIICRTDDYRRFVIDIVDAGKPFNILTVAEPDLTADITRREVGGLGVLLIRRMADDIHYSRKNDKNILTLIMKMKKQSLPEQ